MYGSSGYFLYGWLSAHKDLQSKFPDDRLMTIFISKWMVAGLTGDYAQGYCTRIAQR